MPRFLILFFTAICSLLFTTSTQAAIVRVDDLVVINGTSLQFDPIPGSSDATRDRTWQLNYIHSLDLLKVNEIYQQANGDNSISQRSLEERTAAGATILAGMVAKLASGVAKTRTEAYNLVIADGNTGASLDTMKNNVKSYWALAGIGAYAAGNYAYDVWVDTYW